MAVTYVATGTTAIVASGDMAPGLPAGLAAGDILLCVSAQRDDVAPSMSGDWTPLYDINESAGRRAACWWHRYDGVSSPSTTITRAAGDSGSARISAFRGCAAAGSPIDTFDTFAHTGNVTVCTYPSVTPSGVDHELVFIHHAMNNGGIGAISGADPAPTEQWDFQNGLGLDTGLALANGTRSVATASGSRTATEAATGHHVQGVVVLLRAGAASPQEATADPAVASWTIPTPSIVTAVVAAAAVAIANWALPAPSTATAVSVSPAAAVSAWVVPAAIVAAGAVTVTPTPPVSTWAMPAPTAASPVTASPAAAAASWTVPDPDVSLSGSTTPAPAIASWVLPAVTAVPGAALALPAAALATWTTPAPAASPGAASATPAAAVAQWTVLDPDASTAGTSVAAPASATWTVPATGTASPITITPAPAGAAWTLPVPVPAVGAVTAFPAVAVASWQLPDVMAAVGALPQLGARCTSGARYQAVSSSGARVLLAAASAAQLQETTTSGPATTSRSSSGPRHRLTRS